MGTKRTKERGAARSSPATDHLVAPKDAARTEGESLAELRSLSEYRSLMLANLAHDLRTPLTAILGFAEILVDFEELTESQKGLCERIQNSGRELQGDINLLSDLARLDLNETARRREFFLAPKLHELCEALSRKAKKKNVSLDCRVEDGVGSVVSDESKLRQVLYNFLAWAIARSPEGGKVTLDASVNAARELKVTIADEGESFDVTQGFDLPGAGGGDNSSLLRTGLNVSQRLAATLGAIVTLESREPHGLSIVLLMPAGTVGVPH